MRLNVRTQNWVLSFKERCHVSHTKRYVPFPHSRIYQYFLYKLFFDLLRKHVHHNLRFYICLRSIQTRLRIYHSSVGQGVKGRSMPQLGSLTQRSQKESEIFNIQFTGSGKSPERGVVTYGIPKWNKWQRLTPSTLKLSHGASFPKPKLLNT